MGWSAVPPLDDDFDADSKLSFVWHQTKIKRFVKATHCRGEFDLIVCQRCRLGWFAVILGKDEKQFHPAFSQKEMKWSKTMEFKWAGRFKAPSISGWHMMAHIPPLSTIKRTLAARQLWLTSIDFFGPPGNVPELFKLMAPFCRLENFESQFRVSQIPDFWGTSIEMI